MPSPEEYIRRLSRAPGNTVCPNCGEEKQFGFGTICIKFNTFVCNECKSSHQAISHRCKSISMSTWTMDEVHALERGGNDMCRRTWLASAPPLGQQGRPVKGMPIEVFKKFIIDAYENRMYFAEARDFPIETPPTQMTESQWVSPTESTPEVTDLLDFAGFSSTGPAVASTYDVWEAGNSAVQPPSNISGDPDLFGASHASNGNQPIGVARNTAFADFASFEPVNKTANPLPTKKTIMGNNTCSSISSMNVTCGLGNSDSRSNHLSWANAGVGLQTGTVAWGQHAPFSTHPPANTTWGHQIPLPWGQQQQTLNQSFNPTMSWNHGIGNNSMVPGYGHQSTGFINGNATDVGIAMSRGSMMGISANPSYAGVGEVNVKASSAGSNLSKQQKQKDAFSDLLPF